MLNKTTIEGSSREGVSGLDAGFGGKVLLGNRCRPLLQLSVDLWKSLEMDWYDGCITCITMSSLKTGVSGVLQWASQLTNINYISSFWMSRSGPSQKVYIYIYPSSVYMFHGPSVKCNLRFNVQHLDRNLSKSSPGLRKQPLLCRYPDHLKFSWYSLVKILFCLIQSEEEAALSQLNYINNNI